MRDISTALPGFVLFGVGGIVPDNAAQVICAGASGVSAIRALDSVVKVEKMRQALDDCISVANTP